MQQNNAINDERIVVYYQPIVNQDGKCVKAEALLRLNIDGTMYYPGDFLPVVENENYSHFITKAVLNKVCGHIKLLESQGYEFEKISINLSTEDLLINDGYKDLIDIVENKHKMTFQKIAFEILENTDKVQYEPLVRAMTAFKSITDVEFYLDDFGSGYSNLLRLLSLPVSIIKFDKDILKKIRKNSSIFSTVKTNVETFLEAGYNILFEGVEDEVDIASCKQMNADFLQGYAYSKPVELEAVKTFFNKAE
jgi:EAL domain-containing protein (putative c-di-GMP-specific phosphodiesterase class I)